MILLGITGGVGMGKSTTAGFLARHGVPVVDTDELARALVAPGQPALSEAVAAFGPEILRADGTLDRDRLAARVFCDASARRRLEAMLHPRIRAAWLTQAAAWRAAGVRTGAVVIPLLYETAAERELGPVICTACSAATQQARLRARGWDEAQAASRLAAQWPVGEKMARADFVVWSEGALEAHAEQAARILRTVEAGAA